MRSQQTIDHYAELNITRTASHTEVKAAYRKLALAHHPDKNKAPGAEDRIKRINEAYDALKESKRRRAYDATLPPIRQTVHTTRENKPQQFHRQQAASQPTTYAWQSQPFDVPRDWYAKKQAEFETFKQAQAEANARRKAAEEQAKSAAAAERLQRQEQARKQQEEAAALKRKLQQMDEEIARTAAKSKTSYPTAPKPSFVRPEQEKYVDEQRNETAKQRQAMAEERTQQYGRNNFKLPFIQPSEANKRQQAREQAMEKEMRAANQRLADITANRLRDIDANAQREQARLQQEQSEAARQRQFIQKLAAEEQSRERNLREANAQRVTEQQAFCLRRQSVLDDISADDQKHEAQMAAMRKESDEAVNRLAAELNVLKKASKAKLGLG